MPWVTIPKRSASFADNRASSHWRYLNEDDLAGPRKDEAMLSTTDAKKRFVLQTSDMEIIPGFRPPPSGGRYGGGGTLTLYYQNDLVEAAVRIHGQAYFDEKVPFGRKLSGAEARDAAKLAQAKTLAQEASDPYSVVPPDRLGNLKKHRLEDMLIRYEGGKNAFCRTRDEVVTRLIAAGYSTSIEAVHVVKKRRDDEAAAVARREAAVRETARKAEREATLARQREELKRHRAETAAQFEQGLISIDDLKMTDIQIQLKRIGCPAGGSKMVLLDRLKTGLADRAQTATVASGSQWGQHDLHEGKRRKLEDVHATATPVTATVPAPTSAREPSSPLAQPASAATVTAAGSVHATSIRIGSSVSIAATRAPTQPPSTTVTAAVAAGKMHSTSTPVGAKAPIAATRTPLQLPSTTAVTPTATAASIPGAPEKGARGEASKISLVGQAKKVSTAAKSGHSKSRDIRSFFGKR